MAARGSATRYGAVAVALHWVSAAAIIALFVLGFAANGAADDARETALLRLHVPLGLLVLALTLARLAWAFLDRRPAPPPDLPRWQDRAARSVHVLLYGLVLAIGGSGVALMALSGAGDVLSGAAPGPLPAFEGYLPMLAHLAGALLLLALLGAHVGAALHHQLVRRDRILARMGIGRAVVAGAGPAGSAR